ncbi:VOC family protein [Pseudonocardia humida]|uniref:VOC family protein n=1 Tax=Pseudonocardia humida TaxID=2800819 RepID=A0ABT1A020_9PSEU|nr:VOC family protein [Pseudonocardia humida]MCO1656219.1 VOC family protein [Pseudonocardia humida]
MTDTIDRVHHVGHVVPDIGAAADRYRRMGFRVPPPSFPVLPAAGGPARAVGAGNTHLAFRRNFVELVTVLDGADAPAGQLVALDVPAAARERVAASIAATTARVRAALDRFAGLHILVLATSDADAAAARLTGAGIGHGGVVRLTRPSPDGGAPVPVALLEVDAAASPEGRLAFAEELDETGPEHPNGALDLLGPVLCVPDAELDAHAGRYRRLLARPVREVGPTRVLDLDAGRVVLVGDSALGAVLPGERAPALPAFAAFAVRVRDLASTRALLVGAGFGVRDTPDGAILVPAAEAGGCAVVFTDRGH